MQLQTKQFKKILKTDTNVVDSVSGNNGWRWFWTKRY
jgi:hypothetical protein